MELETDCIASDGVIEELEILGLVIASDGFCDAATLEAGPVCFFVFGFAHCWQTVG